MARRKRGGQRIPKWVWVLILTLAAAGLHQFGFDGEPTFTGKVISVHDGDTLTVETTNGEARKVRLSQVDAPELAQPYGEEAHQVLTGLAEGQYAEVWVADTDKYGRTVGRVAVKGHGAEEVQVDKAMLSAGAAWVYREYAWDPFLYYNEFRARQARAGLWQLPREQRMAPWEWRHSRRR